jgi:hypothetical protein
MRNALIASALLVAFSAAPSMARDYSWCARTPSNAGNPECNFKSFRQCQATVDGQGGDCIQNPRMSYGRMRNGGNEGPRGGDWTNTWDNNRR